MTCGKQISLSADGRRVTYCMKETLKTDPKTGVLYHDGPCEAWDDGRVYRAYDPNAVATAASTSASTPLAMPIEQLRCQSTYKGIQCGLLKGHKHNHQNSTHMSSVRPWSTNEQDTAPPTAATTPPVSNMS